MSTTTQQTMPMAARTETAGGLVERQVIESSHAIRRLAVHSERLQRWGCELAAHLRSGGRALIAGNGGSAAEAQHLSSELVGRYRRDRPAFSAIALNADSSTVTAVGNDYGFDQVFARQVRAHGRRGDVLVLLSTSGRSANLLEAARVARAAGLRVWTLVGDGGSPLANACDEAIVIDAEPWQVQEAHLVAIHALCSAFDSAVEAAVVGGMDAAVSLGATGGARLR